MQAWCEHILNIELQKSKKNPLGKNTYIVYLDATGLASVSKEVFNAIGGDPLLLGGADWPPKLRVGRHS